MKRGNFPYFHPHRVRYYEIDMQGVVFNSHYLNYFDAAITEYLRHCGFDYVKDTRESGMDFHLVKATIEYLKPVHYDEDVDIGVKVARLGRSSLHWELGLFGREAHEVSSTGEIIWVYTSMETHRSAPIPDFRREQMTHPPAQDKITAAEAF